MALSDFKPLGGKTRQYQNTKTGEIISRRAFDKLRGIDYETKAERNRKENPIEAILRPAKGRKSARKLSQTEKELIAEMRLEEKRREETRRRIEKETRKIARTIQRKTRKKVHRKRVTKRLLRPGSYGARISFTSYDGYLEALNEARASGVVISYGLGLVGVDEHSGNDRAITVFPLIHIKTTIPKAEFYPEMAATLEEYSYFVFSHYFMHLAYEKTFAKEWARKNRGKKKRK